MHLYFIFRNLVRNGCAVQISGKVNGLHERPAGIGEWTSVYLHLWAVPFAGDQLWLLYAAGFITSLCLHTLLYSSLSRQLESVQIALGLLFSMCFCHQLLELPRSLISHKSFWRNRSRKSLHLWLLYKYLSISWTSLASSSACSFALCWYTKLLFYDCTFRQHYCAHNLIAFGFVLTSVGTRVAADLPYSIHGQELR